MFTTKETQTAFTQELAETPEIHVEFEFELVFGCCALRHLLLLPSFHCPHIQLLAATHRFESLGLRVHRLTNNYKLGSRCPLVAKSGNALLYVCVFSSKTDTDKDRDLHSNLCSGLPD